MSLERKIKIEILKRKNRRNNLVKELSRYINVSLDSFLEVDNNKIFCKAVFKKLETIQNKVIIQGQDYKENVMMSKEYLENFSENINLDEKFARVFFYGELEVEAVKIKIEEVFNNIDKILKITKFSDGNADFILADENLNFGICIERTEYYYEFCIWGIKMEGRYD